MPTVITQRELKDYLLAKKRHAAAEEKLAAKEAQFKAALEAGATIDEGLLTAYIKNRERRDVSWKTIVERELGEAYATRVLAATAPKQYSKLVVESV